jgi:copper(I)-binding protein
MSQANGWWRGVVVGLLMVWPAGAQTAEELQVRDAWVRESAQGSPATAAYLVIRNTSAQATALRSVTTAAAGLTELHTMRMVQRDGREMMTMLQVSEVPVPAHADTELKPGGVHVMLFKLPQGLVPGGSVTLNLAFANGITKTVTAAVRPMAATGGMHR